MVLVSIMVIPEKVEKSSSWNTSTCSIHTYRAEYREKKKGKRGFEDEGLYVVIGEICPLGCWEFQTGEL